MSQGQGRSGIFQSGCWFSSEQLEEICETVEMFSGLSRRELASTICEHRGWLTLSGQYKLDACLKLLEKLEDRGLVRLPEKRNGGKRTEPRIVATPKTQPGRAIRGRLQDIRPVRLTVVSTRSQAELCNEYLDRYHYLGYKQPFGCHLRYLIESEKGLLGCMLFAGAARALRKRDEWIGWNTAQRLRNLGLVVNNSRFLIFPWVEVKYLASHVLGQVARRIRGDWREHWNYRPVLLETFVDPRYYAGTCYRAANWQYLGMTTGQGLVRPGKHYRSSTKKILVRPLVEGFRSMLCSQGQDEVTPRWAK